MLFDYIFLPESNDYSFAAREGKPHKFAIPLDQNVLNQKAAFFRVLYSTSDEFCFVITREIIEDDAENTKEALLRCLTTTLFLPNYLKHKQDYLILLDDNFKTDSSLDVYKHDLTKELAKQGINKITIDSLNCNLSLANDSKRACVINNELNNYLREGHWPSDVESFIKRLIVPQSLNKKWIVPVEDEKDFECKIGLIEQFENKFSSRQPLAATVLELFNNEEEIACKLSIENEILKFKLENHADYLKLLKADSSWYMQEYHRLQGASGMQNGSSDSQRIYNHLINEVEYLKTNRKNILDWYAKEYEVLPKWYKRFGHIIKVLMRKRTLKSLFK
jgi:hypothetical protein